MYLVLTCHVGVAAVFRGIPRLGTTDAENPHLANIPPLKPGVGQNIASHASPTANIFFLVLISTFPVYLSCFFLILSLYFNCVSFV